MTTTTYEAPAKPDSGDAGFSILEYVLYIGLVALAIGAILGGLSYANTGDQSNKAMQLVTELRNTVKGLYGNQSSYGTGDLTQTLISANAIPRNKISNGVVRNPFGGVVTITGAGTTFSITMDGIPTSPCTKLGTQDSGMAAEGGTQSITINGNVMQMPVPTSDATAACNQAGGGASGGNSITWNVF